MAEVDYEDRNRMAGSLSFQRMEYVDSKQSFISQGIVHSVIQYIWVMWLSQIE